MADRRDEFSALYARARMAGLEAGNAIVPTPMVVSQVDPVTGTVLKRYEPVMDGVCGFAWVTVRPGNSPFANFLKKASLARKAYGGGVMVWVGDFNQSMTRKEAFADAFAKVLTDAGLYASAGSRMD